MKKALYYILIGCCAVLLPTLAWADETDSLKNLVKTTEAEVKVNALNQLAEHFINRGENGVGLAEARHALQLSQELLYLAGEARAYHNIGRYYYYKGSRNPVLVVENYKNALEKYKELQDSENLIQVQNDLSLIYSDLGNYQEALNHVIAALNEAENAKNGVYISESANTISGIYQQLGNYAKSKEFMLRALTQDSLSGDSIAYAMSLNNYGTIFQAEGQYSRALHLFNKAEEILENAGSPPDLMRYVQSGIGEMQIEKGQYDEALANLFEALEADKKAQDEEGIGYNQLLIGRAYLFQEDYNKALNYVQKSLAAAKALNSPDLKIKAYQNLAEIYEKMERYTEAIEFERQHVAAKDSIYKATNVRHLANMQAQYELEKKEVAISVLTKDQELSNQRSALMVVAIGAILIILCFILILYFNKRRTNLNLEEKQQQIVAQNEQLTKVNQQANEQKRELEENRKQLNNAVNILDRTNQRLKKTHSQLTSSINYAKRIQEAMLPEHEMIAKTFKEFFILHRPRDIVSGDFYWVADTGSKIVLVVADCTGHGVPGGFMSMLGDAYLNQIIKFQNLDSPVIVLELLHHHISLALKQARTENKDGMDLTVTIIDKKEKVLRFAGANNPLVYVKNDAIHHIKGDKIPVGGMKENENRLFTEHRVVIDSPITFFTYTDGYQDQFGGEKGRKFMSKNFRRLLTNHAAKPLKRQQTLLEDALDEWQGNKRQIDDILVVGVRITPEDFG